MLRTLFEVRCLLRISNLSNACVRRNSRAVIPSKISQVKIIEDDDLSAVDNEPKQSLLASCDNDFSDYAQIDCSFNFAKYVNKSETLQNLVKLGVNLHKFEYDRILSAKLMQLDFEKDIKKYILFLSDYVPPERLGFFFTKNPKILFEDLNDLQVRINYLESKKFTHEMMQRIFSYNPLWLSFTTKKIDERLGFYQKEFKLTGDEVRTLSAKHPRLMTYDMTKVFTNIFTLKELMGLTDAELKEVVLHKPYLLTKSHKIIEGNFSYVHTKMKIPIQDILKTPEVLLCKEARLKNRHEFLEKLGKVQYDCTKSNYVSLKQLFTGSDADFCFNIAKCPVTHYNTFLKSLY